MSVTVTDIIVTPAKAWLAPVGEAIPDETSVGLGAAWGGNWVDLGGTTTPITMAYSSDEKEVELEQFTAPVARFVTKEGYKFETMLAQLTPATLAKVLNGANTSTAAGASQKAFDEIKAGGKFTLTQYTFGVEGRYRNAAGVEFPVRAFLTICTIRLNGNLQFAKSDVSGIPLQVSSLADTTAAEGEQLFKMHRVTAVATS